MESAKPSSRACTRLLPRIPACSSTETFGQVVRKTRRKPVTRFPRVEDELHLHRIPSPFTDLLIRRKYSDQPVRQYSFNVEIGKSHLQCRQCAGTDESRNQHSSARALLCAESL